MTASTQSGPTASMRNTHAQHARTPCAHNTHARNTQHRHTHTVSFFVQFFDHKVNHRHSVMDMNNFYRSVGRIRSHVVVGSVFLFWSAVLASLLSHLSLFSLSRSLSSWCLFVCPRSGFRSISFYLLFVWCLFFSFVFFFCLFSLLLLLCVFCVCVCAALVRGILNDQNQPTTKYRCSSAALLAVFNRLWVCFGLFGLLVWFGWW